MARNSGRTGVQHGKSQTVAPSNRLSRLRVKGESLRKAAAKRQSLDAEFAIGPDEHADARATPRR
jgi:hypothetical protein